MEFAKKRKIEEDNSDCGSSLSPPSSTLTPQDIYKILEPFTKDQLLHILQSATLAHHDVLNVVRSVADLDVTRRRLFINGLAGETTNADLRDAFSAYGPIEEINVIFNKATSRSKGYGFVTFRHVDGALKALKEPSKVIDGHEVHCRLADDGNKGKPMQQQTPTQGISGDGMMMNHHHYYQQQQLSLLATQYHGPLLGMQSSFGNPYSYGGYVHGVGYFAPNSSWAFGDGSAQQQGMFHGLPPYY